MKSYTFISEFFLYKDKVFLFIKISRWRFLNKCFFNITLPFSQKMDKCGEFRFKNEDFHLYYQVINKQQF